jgi:hypothetical protein
MTVSSFKYKSTVVYARTHTHTQTHTVSFLGDPKGSRPDGVWDVRRVGRCSILKIKFNFNIKILLSFMLIGFLYLLGLQNCKSSNTGSVIPRLTFGAHIPSL